MVINDEEKLAEKMMEDNATTSASQLFKLGVQVANAVVVTNTGWKKINLMKIKKQNRWRQKPKKSLPSRRLLMHLRFFGSW